MNESELVAQIADVRGEALAGRLLSTIALDFLLLNGTDKKAALDYFTMQIDRDLNAMTFVDGDAMSNEKVREIARLRAHQAIDSLRDAHKA
ncbi:hypothetical protein G6M50_38055 [Agrobacterium rhizogenes]|nr:hypothetical protein [Rhizobium rhizogenes]NTJ83595.1 hypothetical protein [Rhizobium rhizogenes]